MKNKKNKNGYVMMYSVIILGSMISVMAIYMTWVGVFSLQNIVLQRNSKIAQDLADTCAENALMAIWNNVNASGTTTRNNLFGGSCFYQINVLAGENREIFATGVISGVTRKTKVLIDQVNLKVNVSSWREVADF